MLFGSRIAIQAREVVVCKSKGEQRRAGPRLEGTQTEKQRAVPWNFPWALVGLAGLPKAVRCCGWRNWEQASKQAKLPAGRRGCLNSRTVWRSQRNCVTLAMAGQGTYLPMPCHAGGGKEAAGLATHHRCSFSLVAPSQFLDFEGRTGDPCPTAPRTTLFKHHSQIPPTSYQIRSRLHRSSYGGMAGTGERPVVEPIWP
jgi:hypothetical protein